MAVFRVRLTGFLIGQTHENVLHFENNEGSTDTAAQLANEIKVNWCELWRPVLPQGNFVWTNIKVQNLTVPSESPTNLAVVINGSGTTNNAIIPFTTFNIRFLTAVAGRKGRGRMYLGTPNSGNVTGGVLTTATTNFFNGICANVLGRYGQGGTAAWKLIVRGRGPNAQEHIVTQMFVDTIVRAQRRRNIGVGA